MMDVAEARRLVLQHAAPLPARLIPTAEALGLQLAAAVRSDIDSPPHHKAMMDGYAVVAADLQHGPAELTVIEEVAAGAVPQRTVHAGEATRIMTGAPLPSGADCVVMVERTELLPSAENAAERVRIEDTSLQAGSNILPQAFCLQEGQTVLQAGHVLRGIELGLLAEVGCCEVMAVPRPRVAVLSTGDELVPASIRPAAGQIRNSNTPMLLALAHSAGTQPLELAVARDNEAELETQIAAGLQADCLLLSGGVSAGKFDYTPQVLARLGVEQVFHKVSLKPGKPLWFGVLRGEESHSKLVFGLPGNPVSSFVCFELFVRPALAAMAGRQSEIQAITARLAKAYSYRTQRPIYHPARCDDQEGQLAVEILPWKGSADMLTVCQANCLAILPVGNHAWDSGTAVEVLRY